VDVQPGVGAQPAEQGTDHWGKVFRHGFNLFYGSGFRQPCRAKVAGRRTTLVIFWLS
jgi:hypothetical protein